MAPQTHIANLRRLLRFGPPLCIAALSSTSPAAVADPRVQTVPYDAGAVVRVAVAKGVVTHVVLGPDERIKSLAPGFGSDCEKPEHDWCIRVALGDNELFVKPKAAAKLSNNLAVTTDQRAYSFEFVPARDANTSPPIYRLAFTYPLQEAARASAERQQQQIRASDKSEESRLNHQLASPPQPRHWDYFFDGVDHQVDFAPTTIFDDGRFTYFRFPDDRRIPAIYAITGDGTESATAKHIDPERLDWVVVHRLAQRFILRAGRESLIIRRHNSTPPERQIPNGTTLNGLTRDDAEPMQ